MIKGAKIILLQTPDRRRMAPPVYISGILKSSFKIEINMYTKSFILLIKHKRAKKFTESYEKLLNFVPF